MPWFLRRSPLAPAVPLEGSDTVQGLRTLERLRMAQLLQAPDGHASGGSSGARGGGWRRSFQRYKGPFIEQLTADDLQQAPKSWAVFWKGSEEGHAAQAYNLPASLNVLIERTEENFVSFLPNYLRLAAGIMLATFYLRPRALLGAASVAFTTWRSVRLAYRRQAQAAMAAAAAGGRNGQHLQQQQQQQQRRRHQAAGDTADPNEQAISAFLTVLTWVLVAYTRCMPMLLLGSVTSLLTVLAHCGLRRAPSEYRHKGRQPLGYTWRQLVRREPVPAGADPWLLFREISAEFRAAAANALRQGRRYCRYYALTALDSVPSVFRRS